MLKIKDSRFWIFLKEQLNFESRSHMLSFVMLVFEFMQHNVLIQRGAENNHARKAETTTRKTNALKNRKVALGATNHRSTTNKRIKPPMPPTTKKTKKLTKKVNVYNRFKRKRNKQFRLKEQINHKCQECEENVDGGHGSKSRVLKASCRMQSELLEL